MSAKRKKRRPAASDRPQASPTHETPHPDTTRVLTQATQALKEATTVLAASTNRPRRPFTIFTKYLFAPLLAGACAALLVGLLINRYDKFYQITAPLRQTAFTFPTSYGTEDGRDKIVQANDAYIRMELAIALTANNLIAEDYLHAARDLLASERTLYPHSLAIHEVYANHDGADSTLSPEEVKILQDAFRAYIDEIAKICQLRPDLHDALGLYPD